MVKTYYEDANGNNITEEEYFSLSDNEQGNSYCICSECGKKLLPCEVCNCEFIEEENYSDEE